MTIFTVTTTADKVANDGKFSLREAVAQANATAGADTIRFAPGLEGKTLTLTGGELVLTRDVTIDGDRDNDGEEVTLSGGDASRILRITGGGTDVSLRDLTLVHCHSPVGGDGGGILAVGRSLRLDGCAVRDCAATAAYSPDSGSVGGRGGAIFAEVGSMLRLDQSTVSHNSTTGDFAHGGGIFCGTVTLTDSTVSSNETTDFGALGGGIYGETITLTDSNVSGNRTLGEHSDGGGIRGYTVTLINSAVSDNSAGTESSGGGIIGQTVTLTGSRVSGNSTAPAYAPGGGIRGDTVTLTDSTVSGNYAYGVGGGILGYAVTLTNSTISNNRTAGYDGGGIRGQAVTLSNSTITGNYHGGVSFATVEVSNSIVAGNLYGDIGGTIISSNGHNVFGSDVVGAIVGDLQGIAPSLLFASLDPDTGGGQLNAAGIVPLRNSVTNPALSGGDPLAALPTDQLGHVRPQPSGSLPDIGAAERNQALSTHPSPNNDVLTGTDSIDTLAGKAGADLIRGRGGNDSLRGEGGSDLLDGGPG